MHADRIKEQLKALPRHPGVYLMKDEQGEIIYIGKAVDLKRRVSGYFQRNQSMSPKIKQMVFRIHSFSIIVVDTELEALILECSLIKKHRPPYNALLKNERWYPYIKIDRSEFPRLVSTCILLQDDAEYYGPYRGSHEVEETIALIRRLFMIRSCGREIKPEGVSLTPCLNYHIGRCMGPCCKSIDTAAYQELVGEAVHFIRLGEGRIIHKLRIEMESAAQAMQYEKAARIRDDIANLERFMYKQRAIHAALRDEDVIVFAKSRTKTRDTLQAYFIRNGLLAGQASLGLDRPQDEHLAILRGLLGRFYPEDARARKEKVIQKEIDEIIIIQGWLTHHATKEGAVSIHQKKNIPNPLESAMQQCQEALSGMMNRGKGNEIYT